MSANNKVIAGDYEGLIIIDNTILSVILATKRQAAGIDIPADENDIEIPLDPKHIQSYKVVPSKGDDSQLVDVVFRDGKRSLIQLDSIAYEAFIKKNFNLDSYKQSEKKPIILGEIAEGKEQNSFQDNKAHNSQSFDNKEFINIQRGKTVNGSKIYGTDHIPFYQQKWFVIICLVIFFPLGLALLLISKAFSKITKIIVTLGFIGFIVYLCSLSGEAQNTAQKSNNTEAITETASEQTTTPEVKEEISKEAKKVDLSSKIAKGADSPMTRKGYPKTYKTWGKAYFNRINEMLPKVALKVAESDKCDIVSYVGLSDNRSTPRKEAVFFADCKNGERFYISEKELNVNKKVESVQEKNSKYDDFTYIQSCAEYTKKQMNHPSTFDYSMFNTSVYHAPNTGRIVVTLPCEAKNSFNLEIEMTAKCYFDDRGLIDFELKEE